MIRAVVLSLHHHYGVRQDLRLPLRLRGAGEAPRSHAPRPHSRVGGPHRRAGGHHPRLLPGPPGPGRDGRYPGGTERRHPLCHRRGRHPEGGRGHRQGGRSTGEPHQRHRHSQDHRQRHLLRPDDLRFRDGRCRGAAGHLRRSHRGPRGKERHRPREAHGARLRVHCRLLDPGRQRGELLPGAGGPLHCRRIPGQPAKSGWRRGGMR